MAKQKSTPSFFRHPSVAIVIVAGTLTMVFFIAIGRELFQGHEVRTQVKRLRDQVAAEQSRQQQLQDLLGYLQSPTFQERQARLELGLKKDGERVIIVPPNGKTNTQSGSGSTATNDSPDSVNGFPPTKWLDFFLHKK